MQITQVETPYLRLPEITDRADGTQDTLIVRLHTDTGIMRNIWLDHSVILTVS